MDSVLFESLPEELIVIICEYLGQLQALTEKAKGNNIINLLNCYKDNIHLFNIISKILDDIKLGNIDPDSYFKLEKIDLNSVKFLIKCFISNRGDFMINYRQLSSIEEINSNKVNENYGTILTLFYPTPTCGYLYESNRKGSSISSFFICKIREYYLYFNAYYMNSFIIGGNVIIYKNWKHFFSRLDKIYQNELLSRNGYI